jgi:DNA helicase-4
MTGFVGRARRLDLDSEALAARVEAHEAISVAEGLFLGIGQSVYAGYLQRLIAESADDFDGLMWRAVRRVRDGETPFVRDRGRETGDLRDLRYVLVDEFQDFTPVFYQLLDAIRQANPAVEFMCVGDDWQAINGWAGADLAYFERFTDWFQGGRELAITTNYRSAQSIVAAGNVVMRWRGKPARPREGAGRGAVRVGWLDQFQPSSVELDRHEGDELTPAVLRVVSPLLATGRSAVLLSRRNHVGGYVRYRDAARRSVDGPERFLAHLRSYLPVDQRDRLTISTAHRYKGRESDAVVVLDAIDGAYPLVHPNWSFLRLFGDRVDSIVEADRRLFYVAVTRAQNDLFVLSESDRASPFLDDLRRGARCEVLSWDQLAPAPSLEGERVEVRVSGYRVRDQLSALQFQYNPRLKVWSQLLPRDGFRIEALVCQPWSGGCDSITVCDESGAVLETWAPSSGAGGLA